MENQSISSIRQEYLLATLSEKEVAPSPIDQFERWLNEAMKSEVLEPTAMVLSTVSAEGQPSSRVVLLKDLDSNGFVFYTNYSSKKGVELSQNARASLLFFWPELQRQIRIEGEVKRVNPEQSTTYFQSRPKGSQLGAWASPQSQVVPHREFLDERIEEMEKKFEGLEVLPRPEHWGGFSLIPNRIEFWQGRGSRMHDRIRYERTSSSVTSEWKIERLAP